jgi:hypothetical protein
MAKRPAITPKTASPTTPISEMVEEKPLSAF